MKLASCKSAFNLSVVYCTDRSKAVVPVLVLLFVALWFILRGDLFYVLPCGIFVLAFFVLFFFLFFFFFSVLLALRLPRLGKRELILVLFVRLFDLCLFWICRFSLPLDVWEGLRFVNVALPGLFSYLFFCDCVTPWTFLLPFFHSTKSNANIKGPTVPDSTIHMTKSTEVKYYD